MRKASSTLDDNKASYQCLEFLFFLVGWLALNLERFPGWPLVTCGHLRVEARPHLSSHLSSLGRTRGCSRWLALPSDGSHKHLFLCRPMALMARTGTVWPGVNDSQQVEAAEACCIPACLSPGQEKRASGAGGNNLGKAERSSSGQSRALGAISWRAAAAPSSLESNGVDPASAGTRYTRHQNQGAMPVFKLKLKLKRK